MQGNSVKACERGWGGGVTSRCRETSTLEANKIVNGVNRLGVNADRHEARGAPEG